MSRAVTACLEPCICCSVAYDNFDSIAAHKGIKGTTTIFSYSARNKQWCYLFSHWKQENKVFLQQHHDQLQCGNG